MARKPVSFRVNEKKKEIILYTNVELNPAEEKLKEFYLSHNYTAKMEEKKKGITVDEMREELKKDADTYNAFEKVYKEKNGFHKACKIYTEWKKTQN